jgi:hypothetical protein
MRLIDVDSLDDRKEHKLYCEIKEEDVYELQLTEDNYN